MNSSIEQSIKSKIKQISASEGLPFQEVFSEFFIERFLARVATSPYEKNLIFKGGMCLKQYIDIDRTTKDIDFLLKDLQADQENIKNCLNEIMEIDLQDGVIFNNLRIGFLEHSHMKYPGYRVFLNGKLGQSKVSLQVDIGVGDIVKPKKISIELLSTKKGALFEKEIKLWAYSLETIFSEKYHTAIRRAEVNSRMRDYHDMIALIESDEIHIKKLKKQIEETFNNRNTKLSFLDQNIKTIESLQKYWENYLSGLPTIGSKSSEILDPKINKIIERINSFMRESDLIK